MNRKDQGGNNRVAKGPGGNTGEHLAGEELAGGKTPRGKSPITLIPTTLLLFLHTITIAHSPIPQYI